jgi:hypothetical protein
MVSNIEGLPSTPGILTAHFRVACASCLTVPVGAWLYEASSRSDYALHMSTADTPEGLNASASPRGIKFIAFYHPLLGMQPEAANLANILCSSALATQERTTTRLHGRSTLFAPCRAAGTLPQPQQ